MRKCILSILFILFVFCGCSYKPPQKIVFQNYTVLNNNYEETWQKLVTWFSEHNSPIKNLDKNSGLITTERNLGVDDLTYCNCGEYAWNQHLEMITGNMNVTVKKIDSVNTKVTINIFYRCNLYTPTGNVFTPTHTPAGTVDGQSTGKLETEIFKDLQL